MSAATDIRSGGRQARLRRLSGGLECGCPLCKAGKIHRTGAGPAAAVPGHRPPQRPGRLSLTSRIPGRTADDAVYWLALARRPGGTAVRRMPPHAQLTVGLFHVMQPVNKTLGDVHRRATRHKYGRRGKAGDLEYCSGGPGAAQPRRAGRRDRQWQFYTWCAQNYYIPEPVSLATTTDRWAGPDRLRRDHGRETRALHNQSRR